VQLGITKGGGQAKQAGLDRGPPLKKARSVRRPVAPRRRRRSDRDWHSSGRGEKIDGLPVAGLCLCA